MLHIKGKQKHSALKRLGYFMGFLAKLSKLLWLRKWELYFNTHMSAHTNTHTNTLSAQLKSRCDETVELQDGTGIFYFFSVSLRIAGRCFQKQ